MVFVRPATLADADAWVRIVHACSPFRVQDAGSTAYEMRREPPEARRLVAEVNGVVVGVSGLRAHAGEDDVRLMVMVQPGNRRGGVGRALLERQLSTASHTGRDAVTSIVEDDDESRMACARWGFRLTRRLVMSAVDPRTVDRPGTAPEGARLVRLADLGPERVFPVHSAVVRDDPSGRAIPYSYPEFLDEWTDPRMRPDLAHGILIGEELVAFTILGAANGRAWSDMTGTLPAFRRRGLGLLVKQHTLRAAAGSEVTFVIAANDESNAPMLAINRRLGYRPFTRPRFATRAL